MEAAITEINGLGWFQIRTALLIVRDQRPTDMDQVFLNLRLQQSVDPLLAAPLSAAQGLWQMQVFFGQVLPHECENDVNKTGNIISKYIERMRLSI